MNFLNIKFDKPTIIVLASFLIAFTSFLTSVMSVAAWEILIYTLVCIEMYTYSSKTVSSCRKNDIFWKVTSLYMVMLCIRLFFDFVMTGTGFFMYKTPATIMYFFAMTMVVPMAFFRNLKVNININTFILIAGAVICLCLGFSLRDIMNQSVETLNSQGQYSGGGNLSIIAYGHYGVSLILISMYMFMHMSNKYLRLLALVFLGFGISAVVMSGSRGPIIALVVCGIIMFSSRFSKWYYLLFLFLFFMVFSKLFTSVIFQFNDFLMSKGFYAFARIVYSFLGYDAELTTSGRDIIFDEGLKMFWENPILGASYLMPDASYVHIIFIEQFMALGFLGGSLFVVMNIVGCYRGWLLIKQNPHYTIFFALFLQYMIYGCFSSTIIALPSYWLFLFITINLYNNSAYDNNISRYSNI